MERQREDRADEKYFKQLLKNILFITLSGGPSISAILQCINPHAGLFNKILKNFHPV